MAQVLILPQPPLEVVERHIADGQETASGTRVQREPLYRRNGIQRFMRFDAETGQVVLLVHQQHRLAATVKARFLFAGHFCRFVLFEITQGFTGGQQLFGASQRCSVIV